MGRYIGKLLPNARELISEHVSTLIGRAADVAADVLDENIALHFTSGTEWKNLPRRSSSPGEFPQQQSGALRDSIKFYRERGTRWHVGFSGLSEDYLKFLEFAPPDLGGRAPLSNTMLEETTKNQMLAGIEQGSKL